MDAPTSTTGELEELVREHAALRRVATLVAREPSPEEVFAAVTRETGQLLGAQRATLLRVASPERAVVAASWSDGSAPPVPVGHSGILDGRGILGRMISTHRPVRIEDFDVVGGVVAELMRELGIKCGAGGPVIIGSRVWGAVTAVWPEVVPMPDAAEHRVAAFAELVAYAIENAETRDELAASRARLVEAADEARRRIERDLHDGAQQRLVTARLELTRLEQRLAAGDTDGAREILAGAREHLDGGLGELRDLARGIHPAVLTDRGLEPALDALVERASVPVELRADVPERLDTAIEAAAYFLVSEALTNVAKYARADAVTVEVDCGGDTLVVTVADDGAGGADPDKGSGLRGLVDRVEAVGGRLEISSPPGKGTRLQARLPRYVLGTPKARPSTMSNENTDVVRAMFDAFNRGDFEASLAYLDDDVEWHDPPDVPGATVHKGPEGVRDFIARWLAAWESYTVGIEELIDAGDQVVVVHLERGRGKGSGADVEYRSANVFDVRDGKVVRRRPFRDRAEALAAAGLGD